jgi:phage terminase large subunit GpA-like protein
MKKKKDLVQLALLGVAAAGLVAAQPLAAAGAEVAQTTTTTQQMTTTQTTQMTPDQQRFYNMLNAQGKQQYMQMDSASRSMAIQVFNAPAGQNVCAGLNACANPGVNDCSGQGSCKNTSNQAFTDPNEAVQVVFNKMKKNRQGMTQPGMQQQPNNGGY